MSKFLPILLIAIALQSCNEYQKVLKNDDVKAKYDMAENFYKEGDFKRANRIYEQIAPKYVGKPQGERVLYFLSNTYFQREDYNLAAYQFDKFIKSYPNSDKVMEAHFFVARCYYALSPDHSLDQVDTDKAIEKLQEFINTYPDSEYFAQANVMAKELTIKKQRKEFEIVKQYNKLGEFNYGMLKSAIAASNNFLSDNPGSVYREEAMFIKFDALTLRGLKSVASLQQERLTEAKQAYSILNKNYPEGKFAKKAGQLSGKIEKQLQQLDTAELK